MEWFLDTENVSRVGHVVMQVQFNSTNLWVYIYILLLSHIPFTILEI